MTGKQNISSPIATNPGRSYTPSGDAKSESQPRLSTTRGFFLGAAEAWGDAAEKAERLHHATMNRFF